MRGRRGFGSLRARGSNAREAAALGRQSLTDNADSFAANVQPIVESLRTNGVSDLRGLALALNSRGVRTARGGRWHVSNVRNPAASGDQRQ
jgi:hypothetical protein